MQRRSNGCIQVMAVFHNNMIYIDIHFHGLYVCVFSYSFIGAETALVTHLPYTFSSPSPPARATKGGEDRSQVVKAAALCVTRRPPLGKLEPSVSP